MLDRPKQRRSSQAKHKSVSDNSLNNERRIKKKKKTNLVSSYWQEKRFENSSKGSIFILSNLIHYVKNSQVQGFSWSTLQFGLDNTKLQTS